MAFHVRDPETDKLVRELAVSKGVGLTQAVKIAVEEMLGPKAELSDPWAELKLLQDEISQYPLAGDEVDRTFYDWLNDE